MSVSRLLHLFTRLPQDNCTPSYDDPSSSHQSQQDLHFEPGGIDVNRRRVTDIGARDPGLVEAKCMQLVAILQGQVVDLRQHQTLQQ